MLVDIIRLHYSILLQLNDHELRSVANTCRSLHFICRDDVLWRQILMRDFGLKGIESNVRSYYWRQRSLVPDTDEGIINSIVENRLPHIQYGYTRLRLRIPQVIKIVELGRPVSIIHPAVVMNRSKIAKWLGSIGCDLDTHCLQAAVAKGNIKMVQWILSEGAELDDTLAHIAVKYSQRAMLDFLATHNIYAYNCITHACTDDHIEMVHYLLQQGYRPDFETLDILCEKRQYTLLHFLTNYDIVPSQIGLEQLCVSHQWVLVKRYLLSGVHLTPLAAQILLYRHHSLLYIALNRNYYFTPTVVSEVFILGSLRLVRAFLRAGYHPHSKVLDSLCYFSKMTRLRYYLKLGYRPSQDTVDVLACHSQTHTLHVLKQYDMVSQLSLGQRVWRQILRLTSHRF